MKHVCHLITHLRLGAGRYIVDLAVEQLRRGDLVSVCLSDDAERNWKSDPAMVAELRRAGVGVVRIGDMFHRDPEALRVAAVHLKDYVSGLSDRTVIHSHMGMGILVGRDSGATTVVSTCHGWNPARPSEHDEQDAVAFTLASGVTSPSNYWAERVTRLSGVANVKVLPYGFDLTRYPELDSAPTPRRGIAAMGDAGIERRWGKPFSAVTRRIICLAELTARKGQDVLISAMPKVWETWPKAELYLAGDGDTRESLRAQALQIDPHEERIFFRGFIEQPYRMLHHFDLMCLPTRSDNQPVSIVEAMLAGLPVVSTTVGGIPEQIAMGEGGVCVAPDDAPALASALISQLDRRGRTKSGAARAIFDIHNHVSSLDRWYELAERVIPDPSAAKVWPVGSQTTFLAPEKTSPSTLPADASVRHQ
jgi:glycosyltransferase involved in cell wall biosynthesis